MTTATNPTDVIGHYCPGLIPIGSDIGDGSWAKAFDENVAALAALRSHGEHDTAYHQSYGRAADLVAALDDEQVEIVLWAMVVDRVEDGVMSGLLSEVETSSYEAITTAATVVWDALHQQEPAIEQRRDTLHYRIAAELYDWAGHAARRPGERWIKLWTPPLKRNGYPHLHEDIEAFAACATCIDHAAESRIAADV